MAGALQQDGSAAKRGEGERPVLLLVDDLPENLFALEAILRRDDVEIVSVLSATEALEVLLQRRVALAIIDVQMPEIDGFELAELMRGVERTRHVPIIFVTAGSEDQRRLFRGYEAGAVDFLFKPLEAHVLRSKVDVFITLERQRSELETSENRFRRLYDLGMIGIFFSDREGRITDANRAFLELVGHDRSALDAGRLHVDELTPREWRAADAVAREQLRKEGSYGPFEKAFLHREGRCLPVLLGSALLDECGATVSFVLDMREQKEAERMREIFVAILGHDLRNPLSSIIVATHLALSRTREDGVREALQRALHSGERMVRMIDHFLDVARVRLGERIPLARQPTELRSLVEQVVQGAPSGATRFEIDAGGDTVGFWDPDRLFQVLSNLVGNACEHSPVDSPIQVGVDGSRADEVRIWVRNFGPPIPTEARHLIFEPFRGSADDVRTSRGMGLGLYITQHFVAAHGGRISLRSDHEEGTVFEVCLPRWPEEADEGNLRENTAKIGTRD